MNNSHKIIGQLNQVLLMNDEVEKIYIDALAKSIDPNLQHFFRACGFERNQFNQDLRRHVRAFNAEPAFKEGLSDVGQRICGHINSLLASNYKGEFIDEVSCIVRLSTTKYDQLLNLEGMEEALIKVLIYQRNKILDTVYDIPMYRKSVA